MPARMPEVTFGGAKEFRQVARALERADLGPVLQSSIEASAEPLKRDAKREAEARLPRRGGLNRRVAETEIVTKRRRSGVRLVAQPGPVKDPASVDRGRLLKPTFGHKPWRPQLVRAGWFRDPMQAGAPAVRARLSRDLTRELRSMSKRG